MQEINLPLKVFAAGEEPTGERISHHDNALDEAHASGGVDQCKASLLRSRRSCKTVGR